MTSLHTLLLLGIAVACGALVQGSIGFGMAVVAAPFVVWWAPDLMPGSLLVTSVSLPILQLLHGPRDIAWRPLSWALVARLVTMPVGLWAVANMSVQAISVVVGLLVLVSVAGSLARLRITPTPRNASIAGAFAGFSGTAASIGGPFFALVLQHERPTRVRATLSAFFLIGSAIALAGLGATQALTAHQVQAGLVWLPFLAIGYAAAGPLRARLDGELLRRAVLLFCSVAGIAVIIKAVL